MSNDVSAIANTFDHNSTEYAKNYPEIFQKLRATCPVVKVPQYGGYWLVSDYEHVSQVVKDDATYSSDHDVTGARGGYQGVAIPAGTGSVHPPGGR